MNKLFKTRNVYIIMTFLLFVFFVLPAFSLGSGENLVSNVDGKIHVIILHNGNGSSEGFWFDQTVVFRELLEKMDKEVGFVILLGDDTNGDSVKEILKPYDTQKLPDGTARVKYLTVDTKTSTFYPWARDPYVILTNKDHRLIFLDNGYGTLPFPVVKFNEIFENAETRASTLHRGGGNIRSTDNEIFIGMDTFLGIRIHPRYRGHYDPGETIYSMARDIKKEGIPLFKQKFQAYVDFVHNVLAPDKKMIIPGLETFFAKMAKGEFKFDKKVVRDTGAQAAYHTDVYLGLGHVDENGKRILFAADTRSAAEIVSKMSPEERRNVERNIPGLLESEGFTASGVPIAAQQIAQRFQWEKFKLLDLGLEQANKMADMLDEAARELEQAGYHVVRVPYLPNGLFDGENRNDGVQGISYNYSNVLVEVYGDVKKVYCPGMGFKQLDEAAAAAYASVGFKVIFIKGLLTNALTPEEAGAGLDCLTSEIRFPVRWKKSGSSPTF
ncbi:MAG: hypothetical protein QG657_4003 [Acidobacteriota bacterium]|nr:hypothetical protein [Acidobacteriota bacterium]